jgi:hypothetical protein
MILSISLAASFIGPIWYFQYLTQRSFSYQLNSHSLEEVSHQQTKINLIGHWIIQQLNLIAKLPFPQLQTKTIYYRQYINSFILLSHLNQLKFKADQALVTAFDQFLGVESGDSRQSLQQAIVILDRLYLQQSLFEQSLPSVNPQFMLPFTPTDRLYQTDVTSQRQIILESKQFLQALSQILSQKDTDTFLVLLQNNLELRPTGGFISSIQKISLDNGKLSDISTQDIYQLDSQLNGQVEPPQQLKKYLGESNWYFRDANWYPHFSETAKQAEWFFEKETNQTVDGVIAVNLYTLQLILEAIGPINLPSHTQVSADNIINLAYQYQSVELNPDNPQPEIVGQMARAITEKLNHVSNQQKADLIHQLYQALAQSQLFIYSHQPQAQSYFNDLGFSGDLINPTCPQRQQNTGCIIDYISVIDTNVGINKVNYYLDKEQIHQVNVSQQSLDISHQISYRNNAPDNEWPAGEYQNYLRFYLPNNSKIKQLIVDNQSLSPSQYQVKTMFGKQEVGFLLNVPVGESVNVALRYNIEFEKNDLGYAYAFLHQKQSGATDLPITLSVTPKLPFQVVSASQGQINSQGILNASLSPYENSFILVEIAE